MLILLKKGVLTIIGLLIFGTAVNLWNNCTVAYQLETFFNHVMVTAQQKDGHVIEKGVLIGQSMFEFFFWKTSFYHLFMLDAGQWKLQVQMALNNVYHTFNRCIHFMIFLFVQSNNNQ